MKTKKQIEKILRDTSQLRLTFKREGAASLWFLIAMVQENQATLSGVRIETLQAIAETNHWEETNRVITLKLNHPGYLNELMEYMEADLEDIEIVA